MGGILKQCIHDGFGLLRFGERLTGPEYADRFLKELLQMEIDYRTSAFVLNAKKQPGGGFRLEIQTQDGILYEECSALVLACGCREKTARQVWIHGDRPAGVYTAGTAQHFVNLMGCMPTKKCVILGSGDIGMIMARRLTLEGAQVEGVYEIKDAPAGLARNVAQCLNDYNIPLHLSTTVTRVIGTKRVEAVEVCQVDGSMQPIAGTERIIDCDALILSVGLLPENEIAEQLAWSSTQPQRDLRRSEADDERARRVLLRQRPARQRPCGLRFRKRRARGQSGGALPARRPLPGAPELPQGGFSLRGATVLRYGAARLLHRIFPQPNRPARPVRYAACQRPGGKKEKLSAFAAL